MATKKRFSRRRRSRRGGSISNNSTKTNTPLEELLQRAQKEQEKFLLLQAKKLEDQKKHDERIQQIKNDESDRAKTTAKQDFDKELKDKLKKIRNNLVKEEEEQQAAKKKAEREAEEAIEKRKIELENSKRKYEEAKEALEKEAQEAIMAKKRDDREKLLALIKKVEAKMAIKEKERIAKFNRDQERYRQWDPFEDGIGGQNLLSEEAADRRNEERYEAQRRQAKWNAERGLK